MSDLTLVFIKVNGADLTVELMDKLKSVVVETGLGYPDAFTIEFIDTSAIFIDQSFQTFKPGSSIEIAFEQYETNQETTVFDGEITTLVPEFGADYSATLIVKGYDKSHRLMRGTHTRTFVKSSDSDIINKVASEVGLMTSVDETLTVYEHVFQDNQTNMDFLQSLARRNGYQLYVKGRTLYAKKLSANRGSVQLKWGENLISFRARLSAARQVDKVIVRGWDSQAQKAIEGSASSSTSAPAIGAGKTGVQLGQEAFNSSTLIEVHQVIVSSKQAEQLAQAILDRVNAEFLEAEGIADGIPTLVAGVEVVIDNVGQQFGGKYHVTSVRHFMQGGLYQTDFKVEGTSASLLGGILGDGIGSRTNNYPIWPGVYPALVTNNDDPQKLNRVKLKYPWLNDQTESGWARLISAGGGNMMGIHWLPEINDEVLVVFEHGDFNRPYVIGGVHSDKLKPIAASSEGGKAVDKRIMRSRSGHMFIMDDKSGSEKITLESKSGHTVIMDDSSGSIVIKSRGGQQVELKASGSEIAISGASTINVNSSSEVNIDATGAVNVSGAEVTVSGSRTVKVTGAMIQIG